MKRDFVILVVDDSRTNRLLLMRHLTTAGHAVLEADGAASALRLLETARPDLILLDVVMPDISGFELCRRLKAQAATQDIPVIFLTSLESAADRIKGLELGAVDFITKPFDPAEIVARVRTQASLHRMYCTIRETNHRIATDLDVARRIQHNFLPQPGAAIAPGIAFDYAYRPCDELGGDFFNIFRIDDARIFFYISDVSGHGVASALMTIFTDTFLGTNARRQADPAALLALFNEQFFREKLSEKFITAFIGVLNLETNRLTWSSAGQTAPPILQAGSETRFLGMNSFPVGLVKKAAYENRQEEAGPGTTVLMYSDGLTDVTDAAGVPALSEAGLQARLSDLRGLSGREIVEAIVATVAAHTGDHGYPDDLTVFIVRRT